MTNLKHPRKVENWTSETIQKFVDSESKEEIAALQVTFKRQAELMRRYGKDESAAYWEALAKGIADAVDRPDQRASKILTKKGAA